MVIRVGMAVAAAGALVACSSGDAESLGDDSRQTTTAAEDSEAGTSSPGAAASLDIVATIDREPTFTQGLELLDDGRMVHSRGQYGESGIDILSPAGEVVRSRDLPEEQFGEGVTVVPGDQGEPATAYQLTWMSGTVHTWSVPALEPGPTYDIDGEGWGLCHDETRDVLWQSDGSARLRALELPDLAPAGEVVVTQDGQPVTQLNELECVDGMVWANVWQRSDILLVDPEDGAVEQRVSLREVVDEEDPSEAADVLNGIARTKNGELLVTGKNWRHLYRLDVPSTG